METNYVYFTTEEGLCSSKNRGETWEIINNDATTAICITRTGCLFVGGYKKLSVTYDGGVNWEFYNSGLNSTIAPHCLHFLESKNTVYVGTYDQGILVLSDIRTGINTTPVSTPNLFELYDNYPNPFNPETTIEFSLQKNSNVLLKIYNSLGQEIKTLSKGNKPSGIHRFTWDGTNNYGSEVGSGIYIYSLKAGKRLLNKKMVLLR